VPTRLILVGGFLGAGKTTLLLEAARRLTAAGRRVGIITNDQGEQLVDTAMARRDNLAVVEVAGGCFCCRFPDLLTSIRRLQDTVAPDIIFGEPVGSCTDLVATVLRPLRTQYPDQFELAPLTILIDPRRELDVFPTTVDYLYHKQLAEADMIVLSKSDTLDADAVHERLDQLAGAYPSAHVMSMSARSGDGLDEWLEACLAQTAHVRQALDIDYLQYAEAEACLGWLNASVVITADRPFAPGEWLAALLKQLEQAFGAAGMPVAHVKINVETDEGALKASLTQLGSPVSWDTRTANNSSSEVRFTINARVHSEPHQLETLAREFVARSLPDGARQEWTHFECFSPSPPVPTFRLMPVTS
jgi:G3E family GTPase